MDNHKEGVVGFLFNPTCDKVWMIKKNKPAWMKGKWNGVGGKLKIGEKPLDGMRREFYEEAGISIDVWRYLCTVSFPDPYTLHVFYSLAKDFDEFASVKTMTDEPLEPLLVSDIRNYIPLVSTNIKWFLDYALQKAEA